MCKALLIMDMPTKCVDCPCFSDDDHDMWCGVTNESLCRYYTDDTRPSWCPLIDIKDYKSHLDPLEYVTKKREGV